METTALQFVNTILSAGDDDVVSTIGETEESQQILQIVNRAYRKVSEDIDWKYRGVWTRLDTASGTTTTWSDITYPALPWVMKIPSGVESVYEIYYNDTFMQWVDPVYFKNYYIHQIGLQTDADPKKWTSFDEQYIVFDAFDSATESQLSAANSSIRATKFPSSLILTADGDKPDCPERFYSTILNKALHWYFLEIVKNVQVADRYFNEYRDSRSKLIQWARKVRPQLPYNSRVDYSRKRPVRKGTETEIQTVEV